MLSLHRLGPAAGLGCPSRGTAAQPRRHTVPPVRVARRHCSSSHGNGHASTSGSSGELQPAPAPTNTNNKQRPAANAADMPSSLNLAFESMEKTSKAVKTTGLRRAPLSGGVKNATQRFDLPSPCVAVRNLVEQAQFAHLCTVMSHMHHRWVGGTAVCRQWGKGLFGQHTAQQEHMVYQGSFPVRHRPGLLANCDASCAYAWAVGQVGSSSLSSKGGNGRGDAHASCKGPSVFG